MKPDWDKLMAEYEGSKTVLVADVDCTTGGKELCSSVGVRGYPTIKTGSPDDLQDYKGGRDPGEPQEARRQPRPVLRPRENLELCDDEKKKQIAEFTALGAEKREAMIKEKDAESEKLEADFKAFVENLNKAYKDRESAKKDEAVEAIKNSGLGLLKSVHKFAATASTSKSEL
ncbi:unnamed protein product [Prorocentrum cordatum]|uniref:Thioredoxin domain-containing protein n=1 Tax=Prorocentrum cordatum TaxID=2364126 RepID=A0ABN9Y849_9DINO|nr:unnamed protein product [Polarella glacialis]